MSWSEFHRESERLACQAHEALRGGRCDEARSFFAAAARFETQALNEADPGKPRTYGITAVSAVALWFKAGRLIEARTLASDILELRRLPEFAAKAMAELLQHISRDMRRPAGAPLAPPASANFSSRE